MQKPSRNISDSILHLRDQYRRDQQQHRHDEQTEPAVLSFEQRLEEDNQRYDYP
jgi:hypothetical protein